MQRTKAEKNRCMLTQREGVWEGEGRGVRVEKWAKCQRKKMKNVVARSMRRCIAMQL